MTINPWVAALMMTGILVLAFALFRGCKANHQLVADNTSLAATNKQLIKVIDSSKHWSDSTTKESHDSIEFLDGQIALDKEQIIRLGSDLGAALMQNTTLIDKHRLGKYTDTAATLVPQEYITDCEDCFTKLDNTTKLTLRYKDDMNRLEKKQDTLNQINKNAFRRLNDERLNLYSKIKSLALQQDSAISKLKPRGRLYLSWGVLWKPFPWGAGAGLLYQNKQNLIYGAKWYYTSQGSIIETTINFPLSIKF